MRAQLTLMLLASFALLAIPGLARAGCAFPEILTEVRAGPQLLTIGSANLVPTNARIRVTYRISTQGACPLWPEDKELEERAGRRVERADGVAVPGAWQREAVHDPHGLKLLGLVFVPEAPFQSASEYRVVDSAAALLGWNKLLPLSVSFLTGPGADLTPPMLAGARLECTRQTITAKAPDCDTLPCDRTVTYQERRLCAAGLVASESASLLLTARAAGGALVGSWLVDPAASGERYCLVDTTSSLGQLFEPGAVSRIELQGSDVAGNLSLVKSLEWNAESCVDVGGPGGGSGSGDPSEGGCSLGGAPRGPTPLLLLLALAGLAIRSRAFSRRAR